jgi:RimJ/RimL family protein N-acetyltransferase
MVKIESLEIKVANIDLIHQFLMNAGDSLKTFRYFEKRQPEVIYNHLITNVLVKNSQVIGYGHLEREGDKIWLGIAIVHFQLGMGYGSFLLNSLIDSARKLRLSILHLTVFKVNIEAIKLYEKVGFTLIEEINDNTFLMKYEL